VPSEKIEELINMVRFGVTETIRNQNVDLLRAAIDAEIARYTEAISHLSARIDELDSQLRQTEAQSALWQDKALEAEAAILRLAASLKVREGEDIPIVAENWVLLAEGLMRRFEATLPSDPELRELALRILGMQERRTP
jgi:chromosome segregation ATPase